MSYDKGSGFGFDVDRLKDFCEQLAERVPTPAAALETICATLESIYGRQCSYCGSDRTEREAGVRIRTCLDCRKRRSVTAGTYFHNIRKPSAWVCMLGAVDEGIICNKADYKRATGMSYASTSAAFNKIMKTTHDDVAKEEYVMEASSTFLPVFGKRSCETPAREPPNAEEIASQRELEREKDEVGTLCALEITPGVDAFDLMPQAKHVHNLLLEAPRSTEELINASELGIGDVLSGLMLLEIAGLTHSDTRGRITLKMPLHDANLSTRNTKKQLSAHDEQSADAISFIRRCFQSVSRKWVQLYLVAHWWRRQTRLWKQRVIFEACAEARYISSRELASYVSPKRLKVAM